MTHRWILSVQRAVLTFGDCKAFVLLTVELLTGVVCCVSNDPNAIKFVESMGLTSSLGRSQSH